MKIEKIAEICEGKILTGDNNVEIEKFLIDTRKITGGEIYIGIKGDTTNGNMFIEEAFQRGAEAVLIDEIIDENLISKYKNKVIIKVEDSIKALQALAKYKRDLYNIPVIAITGSVGKTSTKDIVANVVSQKYNVLKTEGNYNNHIGLPMTLLNLDNHTAIVVEMGMNHFGELSVLTKIASPTIAVITNVGTSHIGNLGSRENILKAKLEILEGLKENGIIIINNDNDLLHEWQIDNKKDNIITYGINNKSNYIAYNINKENDKTKYDIDIDGYTYSIEVPVVGEHFIYNSLCAIAIGKKLNITEEEIKKGILSFKLSAKRMEFEEIKNNIIILKDYYNASYDSMKSALEVVGEYKSKRKIAVLGDMLELGDFGKELHEKVGEEVYKNNIDILITVGELASNIAKRAEELGQKQIYICKKNEEAIKVLKNIMKEDDIILLKASNAMKFDQILKGIM